MPKDRKKTYSDHQSEASRAKKQPTQKKGPRKEISQAAGQTVRESTQDK